MRLCPVKFLTTLNLSFSCAAGSCNEGVRVVVNGLLQNPKAVFRNDDRRPAFNVPLVRQYVGMRRGQGDEDNLRTDSGLRRNDGLRACLARQLNISVFSQLLSNCSLKYVAIMHFVTGVLHGCYTSNPCGCWAEGVCNSVTVKMC